MVKEIHIDTILSHIFPFPADIVRSKQIIWVVKGMFRDCCMSKAKKYVYMSKMLDIMCNIFPGTDRYLHNVGKILFSGFMKWFHAIDVKVKRYVAKN